MNSPTPSHSSPLAAPVSHLLIAVLDLQVSAWLVQPAKPPRLLPLEAQQRLRVESPESLVNALTDLQWRLKSDELTDWMLHIIVDECSQTLLSKGFPSMTDLLQRTWQVHNWTWLQVRLGLPTDASLWRDESLIGSRLLPWLAAQTDESYFVQLRREFDEGLRLRTEQFDRELAKQQQECAQLLKSFDSRNSKIEKRHASELAKLQEKIEILNTQRAEIEELHSVETAKLNRKIQLLQAQNAKLREHAPSLNRAKPTANKALAAKPSVKKSADKPQTGLLKSRDKLNPQAAWPFPVAKKP